MSKKYILVVFLIILVTVAGIGLYLWNKPHKKVEDIQAFNVSVNELCNAYNKDEEAANAKFLNKVIKLTGQVNEVVQNIDNGIMIVLTASDSASDVQCTFREKDITVRKGDRITVKGFCTGKTITGVSLTDCVLIP